MALARAGREVQWRRGEEIATADAEDIAGRQNDALLGEDGMDLRLQSGSQGDALGSMPDQLAQLAYGGRGEIGLGQAAHPQQVGKIPCVPHIVLHAPVGEALDAERVRQVDGGAGGLEHVRGPVPAVGGLQYHVRVGPRLGDLKGQRHGVVVDPDGLQQFALISLPHDNRAAAVQVDTDVLPPGVLCTHRGLHRCAGCMDKPSVARRRGTHEERRLRPFIASADGCCTKRWVVAVVGVGGGLGGFPRVRLRRSMASRWRRRRTCAYTVAVTPM
nr:hypothetical protein [Streptomyces sp. 1331.2]